MGPGVEVIVLTSIAANVTAIVGGVLVFGESIGSAPVPIVARVAAFTLVIAGGALMPGPTRVDRLAHDPSRRWIGGGPVGQPVTDD
jgi:hypothetical protein